MQRPTKSTLWLAALLGATLVTTSAAASSCVSRSMAKRSMKIAAEFASAMFGIWLGPALTCVYTLPFQQRLMNGRRGKRESIDSTG